MIMNTDDPAAEEPSEPKPHTTEKLHRLQECSTQYVRENPVGAVLGALAVGMVIGWLLPHHRERTWAERYVSGPAGQAKRWLTSAVEHASDGLHECSERTAELAQDAAGAVGKGLRKFRFW
jgi:hypothetical protein